jgi:hypothetical protein
VRISFRRRRSVLPLGADKSNRAEPNEYGWRWDTQVVSIGAAGVQVIEQICEFLVAGSPSCRAHHLPRFRKLRRRFAAASLSTVRAHGFRIPLFLERRALRTGPSRLSGKRPNRRVGVAALRPARRVVRNGGIYVLGARARPMTLSLGLGDRRLFLSSRRRRPSDSARGLSAPQRAPLRGRPPQ